MRTRSRTKGPPPSSDGLLRTIIDSEPECVKLLAADGTVIEMNPAGLAMIEADSLEQVRGRCIYSLVAEEHRGAFEDLTLAAVGGQGGTLQFRAVGLKGGVRWLETRAVPVRHRGARSAAVLGITRDVTQQKRAEDALRESHQFNAEIIASVRDGIVVYDRQLRYVIWNPAMEELCGRPAREVLGRHPLELFPFLKEQGVYAHLERALFGETVISPDFQFNDARVPRSGWATATHGPHRSAKGEIVGVITTVRDITERKAAEEGLRQSHRLLQSVIEGTTDAVFVKDLEGRYLLINTAGAAALDKTVSEVVGQADDALFAPESVSRIREDDRRIREAGRVQTLEESATAAGTARIYHTTKGPYRGPDGSVIGLIGIARDITERKRGEEALRLASSRLNALLEHLPSGILLEDAARKTVYANPALCAMLGIPAPDALIGNDASEAARQARHLFTEAEGFLERTDDTAAARRLVKGERLSLRDGRVFERDAVPVNAQEESLGMLWHYRDVTERERSLSLLHATLESTADGLLVVDTAGRMVSYNQRFARMWHIPDEVLLAGDDDRALAFVLDQLKDPDGFLAKVRELYAATDEESFDVLEFKDGRIFERYSLPQRIAGRSVGRVWSFRDVTERREIEERLRLSQRLEAIGRLAGGVAHDFNNILTALLGYSSLLRRNVPADDPLRPSIEGIQKAALRAASLTQQLLAFSRRQVLRPRVLSLSAVLSGMDDMLRRVIPESIDLVVTLDPAVGRVKADPSQMEQVILNLVVNARDAMPWGGRLTLETSDADLAESLRQERFSIPPGRYVSLAVTDTGVGMDAETRSHIFEPFFTTKGPGQGTGLGLATVYGIVKQSAGYVWAESQPGRGTTLRLFLPRVDEGLDEVADPVTAGDGARAGETVLLVEDDEAVRSIARETLETGGYRVLEARSGEEALSIARGTSDPIHLLFTDVVMPGMSGHHLAARLQESRPRTLVLYTSGYDEETVLAGAGAAQVVALPKPYRPDDLVRRVREVLDGVVPGTGH